MKIKILLAPTIIVLIIILSVWVIYPAYTNGIDGVKEKKQALKEQTRLSGNLDNQIKNVGTLSADLRSNATKNAVIFDYIPRDKNEEKIIGSLDLLAKDSGLSVLNISVFEIKNKEQNSVDAVVPTAPLGAALPGIMPEVATQPLAVTEVVPKKIKVDLFVLGDYGGIKVLLEKIQKMTRFNKFVTLEINTLLKDDQTVSESLSAKITLEFNYLKELANLAPGDIDNQIFSAGAFNKKIIDEIEKSKSIEVKDVLPGQKGTANPFLMIK
jgi:hypothetical protein